MSTYEILLDKPKPWLNPRVNNITIDGTSNLNNVLISGTLGVTGIVSLNNVTNAFTLGTSGLNNAGGMWNEKRLIVNSPDDSTVIGNGAIQIAQGGLSCFGRANFGRDIKTVGMIAAGNRVDSGTHLLPPIDRPITILGNPVTGTDQYISFYNSSRVLKWYIDDGTSGAGLGINESGVSNNRLLIKYTSGDVSISSTTDSSSTSTGSFTTPGGMGVAKVLYVGGSIHLPSTGGTSSALSYYEEYIADATWSGAISSTIASGLKITRIGNVCNCKLTGLISNCAAASLNLAAIPTQFRPSTTTDIIIRVTDNVTQQAGLVKVLATGVMNIYSTVAGANFSAGLSGGLTDDVTFSWLV